ncbi:MAG TPA: hypothetical protein VGK67_17695 [Myxococcales bacterium]|jgi:hypothetical protein
MKRKLTALGARGLLKLLGSMATIAATACPAVYGPPESQDANLSGADAAYGPPIGLDVSSGGWDAAYGPRSCTADDDCLGTGGEWYCGPNGWCLWGTRPDAGTSEDAQ